MKAALLTELNQPLEVSEIQIRPLEIGQVRVRMIASGICGSQIHEIKGNKGNSKHLPHLMGHEGFGIVEEVGVGVSKVQKDDRVVLHWRLSSGIESDFPTYIFNNKVISSGKVTTLAEMVTVSENRLTKVHQNTEPELAALLGCSLTTSLSLIERESDLHFGESVLVVGCGGLGLSIIMAAKIRGSGNVVAVDTSSSKKTLAHQMGADEFFESLQVLSKTFDLIVDTTGHQEIIKEAISLLSNRGRFFLVGQPEPHTNLIIRDGLRLFNGRGQSIRATQGGGALPEEDIPRYLHLFENRRIGIDKLVTHRFSLERINEAFDTLKNGNAGRIIIRF